MNSKTPGILFDKLCNDVREYYNGDLSWLYVKNSKLNHLSPYRFFKETQNVSKIRYVFEQETKDFNKQVNE